MKYITAQLFLKLPIYKIDYISDSNKTGKVSTSWMVQRFEWFSAEWFCNIEL